MTIEIVDLTMKHADVPLFFVCLPEGFSHLPRVFQSPRKKTRAHWLQVYEPPGAWRWNDTKVPRYWGSQDQCSHCHWSLVIYVVFIYIYIYTVYHKCDHKRRISSTYSSMRFTKYICYSYIYIYTVVILFAWMKHVLEDVLDLIVICANRLLFNWWIYETIFDLAVWTVPNRTPKQGVPKWLVWCSALLFLARDKAKRVLGI